MSFSYQGFRVSCFYHISYIFFLPISFLCFQRQKRRYRDVNKVQSTVLVPCIAYSTSSSSWVTFAIGKVASSIILLSCNAERNRYFVETESFFGCHLPVKAKKFNENSTTTNFFGMFSITPNDPYTPDLAPNSASLWDKSEKKQHCTWIADVKVSIIHSHMNDIIRSGVLKVVSS
jgi:hypothetical protein